MKQNGIFLGGPLSRETNFLEYDLVVKSVQNSTKHAEKPKMEMWEKFLWQKKIFLLEYDLVVKSIQNSTKHAEKPKMEMWEKFLLQKKYFCTVSKKH